MFSHNFGRRMSKACERGKPRERKEKRRQKRDLKKGTFTTHPRIRTQTPGGSKAHQFNMSTIVGLLQGYLKHIIKDVCTPSPPLTPHSPPPIPHLSISRQKAAVNSRLGWQPCLPIARSLTDDFFSF